MLDDEVSDTKSWDEAFSRRYEEWSSHMTSDVPFYVELAREADGPLVELAVGSGWSPFLLRWRPAGR